MTTQLDLLEREWCSQLARTIVLNYNPGDCFTSDDAHQMIPEPGNKNWWGVAFARMKSLKLIERIGYATSRRASANGRPVAVWRVL